MDQFFELFGDLLKLQDTKKESYIFIDAKINLLDLANTDSQNYLNYYSLQATCRESSKLPECKTWVNRLLIIFISIIHPEKLSLEFLLAILVTIFLPLFVSGRIVPNRIIIKILYHEIFRLLILPTLRGAWDFLTGTMYIIPIMWTLLTIVFGLSIPTFINKISPLKENVLTKTTMR